MSFKVKFNNQKSEVDPASQLQVIEVEVVDSKPENQIIIVQENPNAIVRKASTQKHNVQRIGILRILFSRIVLFALAISTLGAFAFFYFQTFQPIILSQIGVKSLNQITLISDTYNTQSSKYFGIPAELYQGLDSDSNLVCGIDGEYNKSESEFQKLNQLATTSLQPNPDLAIKFEVYNYYSPSINEVLDQNYSSYSQALSIFQNTAKELRIWPQFMNYRSHFFKTCKGLQQTPTIQSELCQVNPFTKICVDQKKQDFELIRGLCSQLLDATVAFEKANSTLPTWLVGFGDSSQQSINSCRDFPVKDNNLDLTKWRLNWLISYESVINYRPDLNSNTQSLNNATTELSKSVEASKLKINSILNSKADTNSRWYILDRR